ISPDSGNVSNVYYVGDANTVAHDRRANIPHVMTAFAHAPGYVATVETDGHLRVYTNEGITSGSSVFDQAAPEGLFYSVDTDGTNFYALSEGALGSANAKLSILAPSGGTFTVQTVIDLGRPYGSFPTVRYGGGYLVIFGSEGYVSP